MNILSFIAVVVFLISFFEGAYIFLINKRSVLNILFLFICLSMAIWSLGAAFAYSSDDKLNIIIWEKISSIGFIFLHAFTLHFVLEYINYKKVFFKIIIYLPSFLFLIYSFKYPFVFIDYEKIGNYWVCTPNLSSPILLLFMINYLLYYLLCTVFLFFYRKKNINKRIKKQSLIIIFSIIATIFCYNFEPFILSRFLNNRSYALSPIFSIIWISVVWFAFKKYSFLNLDIKGIPLKIVNSLDELIILIDSFLNIKFINERIKNLLEISKSNLKLNDLILEYDIFINKLKTLNYSRQESLFQVSFINKSGYNIASKINLSILIDEYQDTTGYLIIGRIIQNHSSFINKYKISKREFEIVKMLMSGLSNKNIANYLKISERTIKAHITNIYNKMGINSKMELFNIFNSYIN